MKNKDVLKKTKDALRSFIDKVVDETAKNVKEDDQTMKEGHVGILIHTAIGRLSTDHGILVKEIMADEEEQEFFDEDERGGGEADEYFSNQL
jgi:hypothetical protein